jgi:hypothetical protein
MSDRYPEGPAARARLEEFAARHPYRITVVADMEDFSLRCTQLFARAQSDIAGGADIVAVDRSVIAAVHQLKARAVEAMRAAYAQALEIELAAARSRGAHDQLAALIDERAPLFVVDAESDEMVLSLHPALAPQVGRIVAALACE